jgi:uncharacterized protein RhaS with RHS repeats
VLDELLVLDELVTVPLPSSVVVGDVGAPPEEVSTQFDDDGAELGLKVMVVAAATTRRTAFCTTGVAAGGTATVAVCFGVSARKTGACGAGRAWTGAKTSGTARADVTGRTVKTDASAIASAARTAINRVLFARSIPTAFIRGRFHRSGHGGKTAGGIRTLVA